MSKRADRLWPSINFVVATSTRLVLPPGSHSIWTIPALLVHPPSWGKPPVRITGVP